VTKPAWMFSQTRVQRKSGPRRLGGDHAAGKHEKELFGGERATTNNRMELTAAIGPRSAEENVRRNDPYGFALRHGRHHKCCRAGKPTAGGPPTRSPSRTMISGARWKQPPHRTRLPAMVEGHAGIPKRARGRARRRLYPKASSACARHWRRRRRRVPRRSVLHHAVVHQHRIALAARAHAELGRVHREASALVKCRCRRTSSPCRPRFGHCPGAHDKRVINRKAAMTSAPFC